MLAFNIKMTLDCLIKNLDEYITALATVVTAYFACKSFKVQEKLKDIENSLLDIENESMIDVVRIVHEGKDCAINIYNYSNSLINLNKIQIGYYEEEPEEILTGSVPYRINLINIFKKDTANFPYDRDLKVIYMNCRTKKKYQYTGKISFFSEASIRVQPKTQEIITN